jgi:hypothetical protein
MPDARQALGPAGGRFRSFLTGTDRMPAVLMFFYLIFDDDKQRYYNITAGAAYFMNHFRDFILILKSNSTPMKKILFLVVFALFAMADLNVNGQKVNGDSFTFPKGKTEWSDTIYKKLLTKEMAKKGVNAVTLAIRYKYVKTLDEGNWYEIEITNKSADTKVKFKVSSKNSQGKYTVKLDPKQTKVIDKLYWHSNKMNDQVAVDRDGDYINPLFDELFQDRY